MNKKNRTIAIGLVILGIAISAIALSGCGADGENGRDGATGARGPSGFTGAPGADGSDYTPAYNTYTFGSNTTCQKVYTGFSAKKPSNSAATLRIYVTENCTGTILDTLKANGNEFYQTDNKQFLLEGTNATGLKLHVFVF